MYLTVSKNDLRDAVNSVMPAVAVKPSTPIFAGILLAADNSALTVRATNLNLDITAKIPASVEQAGATVVSGKFLKPIVNKLSGEIVTLQADSNLTLKSEAANFNLLTFDAGDFPKPANDVPTRSFRLHAAALKNLISLTAFACSNDLSRPIFTGVKLETFANKITAAATNAHRVAVASDTTIDATADDTTNTAIVPATALKAIAPLLDSQIITIDVFNSAIAFNFDNLYVVSRVIDGDFPDIAKIVNKLSANTTALVDSAEFIAALERIQIIAKTLDYQTVSCYFTADGLELSANAQSIGRAIENVDADVSGVSIDIAFNFQYLLDGLKASRGAKIQLTLDSPLDPAKLQNPDNPDFLYIVTPLRTR